MKGFASKKRLQDYKFFEAIRQLNDVRTLNFTGEQVEGQQNIIKLII